MRAKSRVCSSASRGTSAQGALKPVAWRPQPSPTTKWRCFDGQHRCQRQIDGQVRLAAARSGRRTGLQLASGPRRTSTSPAWRRSPRLRLMITGLVLALPATWSDVSQSRPRCWASASQVSACTAMVSRLSAAMLFVMYTESVTKTRQSRAAPVKPSQAYPDQSRRLSLPGIASIPPGGGGTDRNGVSRLKATKSQPTTTASDTTAGRPECTFSDMAASRILLLARRGHNAHVRRPGSARQGPGRKAGLRGTRSATGHRLGCPV